MFLMVFLGVRDREIGGEDGAYRTGCLLAREETATPT
jgi:hypothetical protein